MSGISLAYVLRDSRGGYLGCCYLYPMGWRTQLTEDLLRYDVDVSWWVTPSAYEAGYYAKTHRALRHWLAADYPFWNGYFSNREIRRSSGRSSTRLSCATPQTRDLNGSASEAPGLQVWSASLRAAPRLGRQTAAQVPALAICVSVHDATAR